MKKLIHFFTSLLPSLILMIIIYFLSLQFFFPGYFRPLTPHHTDAFDYPFIFSSYSLPDFLTAARPVGDFLLTHLFGGISYQFTIICFIALNFLNFFLLLTLVKKIHPQKIPLPFITLFFLLLFTHPGFYLHYTYDVYSVMALFFVLLAMLTYYTKLKSKLLLIILCLLLSGFCKETYLTSAVVFFAAQYFLSQKKPQRREYLSLVIGSILVIGVVLIRGKLAGSSFNALTPDPNAPYYTNFSPFSILQSLIYYLKNFFSPPLLLSYFLAAVYLWKSKNYHSLKLSLTFFLIGLAAYAPYTIIPNHTLPYYYFVAVPFAYAGLLFLPFSSFKKLPPPKKLALSSGVIILLLAHFFYLARRPYQTYQAYLKDEKITHNFLLSLPQIKDHSSAGQKILLIGLEDYIWSPLQSRTFFTRFFKNYQVEISYTQNKLWGRNHDTIEISPEQAQEKINQNYYDIIYHYDPNGYLLKITTSPSLI